MLAARLQARVAEIARAIIERLHGMEQDAPVRDVEYLESLADAVHKGVRYGIEVIAVGEERAGEAPLAVTVQARLAARHGIPLATAMQRYVAAMASLRAFVLQEAAALEDCDPSLLPAAMGAQEAAFAGGVPGGPARGVEFGGTRPDLSSARLSFLSLDILRATRAPAPPSVEDMGWPPQVGEMLPRADEAVGVRHKLRTYSLDRSHERGGAKAKGFEEILGITEEALGYLEEQIGLAIQIHPVGQVRERWPFGISCVVTFPLRGVGPHTTRVAPRRTVWLLPHQGAPPRLTNAYLKP